jgi:hypothetical protein
VTPLSDYDLVEALTIHIASVQLLMVVDVNGRDLRVCWEYLCVEILEAHDPGSRWLRTQRDGEVVCGSVHQRCNAKDWCLARPLWLARDGPLDNALLFDEGADWGSPPTSLDALSNARVETEVLHSQRLIVGQASSDVWVAVCLGDMAVVGGRRGPTERQVSVHDSNGRWSLTGTEGKVGRWCHVFERVCCGWCCCCCRCCRC